MKEFIRENSGVLRPEMGAFKARWRGLYFSHMQCIRMINMVVRCRMNREHN